MAAKIKQSKLFWISKCWHNSIYTLLQPNYIFCDIAIAYKTHMMANDVIQQIPENKDSIFLFQMMRQQISQDNVHLIVLARVCNRNPTGLVMKPRA